MRWVCRQSCPAMCLWALLLLEVVPAQSYRTPHDKDKDQDRQRDRGQDLGDQYHADPREHHRDAGEVRRGECRRCCDTGEEPPPQYANTHVPPHYPQYQVVPQINITILKGEKGDSGERGPYGKSGKIGQMGVRGPNGLKGTKGSIGASGESCKVYYAAFSVGRMKAVHSNDYYQTLVFDTELVNLYGHFNMFTGKFYCYIPGIYYFSLNVHTWNQKETYLHVMHNEREVVILYAQPSDRSIMQSQSLMLQLEPQDQVWIRLYKGERENAIFSDDFDTYITFNGHLIKPKSEV
ncbi:complement C1q tumor necrosis factor-related protein 1 [Osmerus eperlanus]|uniref:complement C1q tumor necrosis factor-related protein 1 n=1 Tax=Osmerus eperlanus TaxID=29151 RepID=UPI002E135AB5